MLSEAQLRDISEFTQRYLRESADASEQPWSRSNPRSAEHRWYHTLNVLGNAEKIVAGDGIPPDAADVARAAAVLHDVSVFECDHAVHGRVSADIAGDYLSRERYAAEFTDRVVKAIVEHGVDFDNYTPRQMGEQFSLEGKILIEADILDKLGASALSNALLTLGKQDRIPAECPSLLTGGAAMQRATYFKDYLWSRTARRLAEERYAFFLKFIEQLSEEVVGTRV